VILTQLCILVIAEVDVAMTELFGGFPAAFYRGYNEVFP